MDRQNGPIERVLDRIIWSADVANEAVLMAVLNAMTKLRIVKIDRLFLTGIDLSVIDRLNELGLKSFIDAKIVEIPSKLEAIARKYLVHKPWMLNCMAGAASSMVLTNEDRDKIDGLKRFADACHEVGTKPCGVSVLTSKSEEVIMREFCRLNTEQVLCYAEMLVDCGFTDMVCSPSELVAIRSDSRFNKLELNTPGIRPIDSDVGDQVRISTPEWAFENGVDRIVLGRPITQGNPAENLRKIAVSCQHLSMFQKAG